MSTLDDLKFAIDNAVKITDLPLKNEIDSSDYFEICDIDGNSFRAAVLEMMIQPVTYAISGENGDVTIPLNKLPISVTVIDADGNVVEVAISISIYTVRVQWNGNFTGQIIIL